MSCQEIRAVSSQLHGQWYLCAETLQLVCNVTKTIKGLLTAFISDSLEPIELRPKSINASFFLSWNTLIYLFTNVPQFLCSFTLTIAKKFALDNTWLPLLSPLSLMHCLGSNNHSKYLSLLHPPLSRCNLSWRFGLLPKYFAKQNTILSLV